MKPDEILRETRRLIKEYAGDDPDRLFYANRFVFARLMLDERKVKTAIKKRLVDAKAPCSYCHKPFDRFKNANLHRLDGTKGYSDSNCVLMHPECHEKCHAEQAQGTGNTPEGAEAEAAGQAGGVLAKVSKRYDDQKFLYWWDVSPSLAERLPLFEAVEFVKKDTNERCSIAPAEFARFLVKERQTTRASGHWGIRVLCDRPNELAFEPGRGNSEWLFLPVEWIPEDID